MVFEKMTGDDYEQVIFCQDETSGLKAIICIHDTTLGPALGGLRVYPYETEEEALTDAIRLAKGMTYKNAAAGLDIGGAKSVIIADPRKDKSEELFRAFGRYVEGLNGRYITAADMGIVTPDLDLIYQETDHVVGISESYGSSGNPSPVTGRGVYVAMKRTAKEVWGDDSLAGKTIAVQGVGAVATAMCELIHAEGGKLVVTDVFQDAIDRAVENFGAEAVGPDEIFDVKADIFAPCAMGACLNDDTIARLKAAGVKAVCGSANNQLLDIKEHGEKIAEAGILYAPDFIVNSGGVINVADELYGYVRERALEKTDGIYDQMGLVFDIAKRDNITTAAAADKMAEERIERRRMTKSKFLLTDHNALSQRRRG